MLLALALTVLAPREIFVSTGGSDGNPGSADRPVATLEAARDLARTAGCHTITVLDGQYRLTRTVAFDGRDSGLTIRAAKGARPVFKGSVAISAASLKPCTDQDALSRIVDVGARAKVKVVQLLLAGLAPVTARGFPQPVHAAPNELFEDSKPLTLARWPNGGYAHVATVIEGGNNEKDWDKPKRQPVFTADTDRAKNWGRAPDAWMYGYWKFDWADESIRASAIDPATGQITLANPHVYGVEKGTPFFAENLLEELDMPGEYYLDRSTSRLYVIPRSSGALELSVLGEPMLSIKDASKVTVRGLDFCLSRGDGVQVSNGERVRVEGCRFFGLGERGAVIEGGHDSGLQSCDLWDLGEGGVVLSGGDRNTLAPGRNFVDNCDIHDFERRSQTYRPAVSLFGVGNRVAHCALHDSPHSAIIYVGNDHVIEYNEFYKTISLTGDGGVVYTGRDWTARGTEIRYNHFHDNIGIRKWEPAIYIDDLGSGIHVHDNLIERSHWGFLIGGGRDNVVENNVLVDCALAFDCDARGLGWAAGSRPTMEERLKAVPYKTSPWKDRYPALVPILDREPMAPMGNVLRGNVLVRSGKVLDRMEEPFKKTATIEGNLETAELPRSLPAAHAGLRRDGLRAGLQPETARARGS